ncbi:stage II sporulation protein M [Candidatus Woesearchaeota archaeon]|nr:stage II sporulation protein M [Candidatus Woesearchaeota archaeon]
MVLEAILNPETHPEKKPWNVFLIGFLYSSIAVVISLGMFQGQASLVMVFLTVFACMHVVYVLISSEEKKDLTFTREFSLLKEHGKVISVFMFMFLGFLASYTLWALILPQSASANLFQMQLQTINRINAATSLAFSTKFFSFIIMNNLKVLFFCILFSFIYGAGAIFILTWNASVGGAFLGDFIRTKIIHYGTMHSIILGMARYLPHGILEMVAYFIGGLAGGIISVAVINHDFGSKSFFRILFDSSELILISILVLVLAAFVEVFFTPNLVGFLS